MAKEWTFNNILRPCALKVTMIGRAENGLCSPKDLSTWDSIFDILRSGTTNGYFARLVHPKSVAELTVHYLRAKTMSLAADEAQRTSSRGVDLKESRQRKRISEKQLIKVFSRVIAPGKKQPHGLVIGPGDDAAVVRSKATDDIILTTDIQVEGVHFRRDWFTGRELGWRLAAVNLSDVAAMGGRPLYALLSLAIPPGTGAVYVKDIEKGVAAHLGKHGAVVVGGNVSGSTKHLVCDLTLAGACGRNKAWHRNCRPGRDAIVVVGALGNARAGLALLAGRSRQKKYPSLLRAFKKPHPLLNVSKLLLDDPSLHGAIDVSDGFSTDLIHMCEAGGAGCEVAPWLLPISPALKRFCEKRGEDPITWALKGGEDYALILSVDGTRAEATAARLRGALKIPVRVVGRFTKRKGRYELRTREGKSKRFSAAGWDHLAGERW